MAGYAVGLWRFYCRLGNVEVNGSSMLPGPAISVVLGLCNVTAQEWQPFLTIGARKCIHLSLVI